jgi:outer membrane protein OmpA-like peptidoglycan-associated protein
MKNLLLLMLLFSTTFCFAQTPKPKYLTETQVIELIKQHQPAIDINTILRDEDGDGVADPLDREPNTPKDCPVDTRGEMLDSDGDGVKDCDDKEPFTIPNTPVDINGVATRLPPCNCDFSIMSPRYEQSFSPVYFSTNNYTLSAETQVNLKTIAVPMIKNSTICIAVDGYISQKETKNAKKALNLSYNRAKAIADFLSTNYGISADRLKVKIKGNDDVVKIINTPKDYLFNQRVEVRIVPCTETSDAAPEK